MDLGAIDRMMSSDSPEERRKSVALLSEITGPETTAKLTGLLNDPSGAVIAAAAAALELRGGRDVVQLTAPLIAAERPVVRNTAIALLRKTGIDGLDILHNLARSTQDNDRLFSIEILGSIASSDSLDCLTKALADPNPNVRNAAVIALGQLGDPRAFPQLKQLMHDEEWIRFSLIETLGKLPSEAVADFLMNELAHWADDELTLLSIVGALGTMPKNRIIQPLFTLLDTVSPYIQIETAKTLISAMSDSDLTNLAEAQRLKIAGILADHLPDEEEDSQLRIISALSCLGDGNSVAVLAGFAAKISPHTAPVLWEAISQSLSRMNAPREITALLDRGESLSIMAAEVLGVSGNEETAAIIARKIHSAPLEAKRAMAMALAQTGTARNHETYLTLAEDQDGHIAAYALMGLSRTGRPEDIPLMCKLLSHPYPDVRENALKALVSIQAPEVESVLLELVSPNNSAEVRQLGIEGLHRINSDQLEGRVSMLLDDECGPVRAKAYRIARDRGMELSSERLRKALADPAVEVRQLAIDIIGQEKIGLFRPLVEKLTEDGDLRIAYRATEAIGGFRDEAARTVMLKILNGERDYIKIAALNALAGWDDDALAEELEVWAEDPNPDIARAANRAIKRLRKLS